MPSRSVLHATAFFFCLAVWTIGLLAPIPHKTADVVLGTADAKFWFGKTLHVGAYGFLTLLGGAMALTRPRRWLMLALLCAHALVTEFLQQFVEGRTGNWRDVGLDHAGIALAVAVGWHWWRGLLPEAEKQST